MAIYRASAAATGNIDVLANWEIWDGSAWVAASVLPGAADDVYLNNRTLVANVNLTVNILSTNSNAAPATITLGGVLEVQNGITITAVAEVVAATSSTGSIISQGNANFTVNAPTLRGVGNGGGATAVRNNGTGTVTVNGNSISQGTNILNLIINNAGTGTIIHNGNATGGNASAGGKGANNAGAGTYILTGTISAGTAGQGAANEAAGTFIHTGPIFASSGAVGFQSTNGNATNILTGPFYNVGNRMAVYAQNAFIASAASNRWEFFTPAPSTSVNFWTEAAYNLPAESQVLNGVQFGPSNIFTGTLQAMFSPADFWDYLTSGATPGSMGARVAAIPTNPASVESTGAQIASFNT
jgi:hypothetical protein